MEQFSQPTEVTDLDIAFATNVDHLLPKYEDIPPEFKDGKTLWNKLFADWFYFGVKNIQLTPKAGIDQRKALRHIKAVMGSYEPKHEHKEAGVAFLMSKFFDGGKWERAKEVL